MRNLDEINETQEIGHRQLLRRIALDLPRDVEGAYDPELLAVEFVKRANVPNEKAQLDYARKQIAGLRRPNNFKHDYQISLPGLETYTVSLERHVLGPEGKMVENSRATFRYKQAEANRTMDHAANAIVQAQQRQKEAAEMSVWSVEKISQGSDPSQLTFKVFLDETGSGKEIALDEKAA